MWRITTLKLNNHLLTTNLSKRGIFKNRKKIVDKRKTLCYNAANEQRRSYGLFRVGVIFYFSENLFFIFRRMVDFYDA